MSHPQLTGVELQHRLAPSLPDDITAATSGVPFIEATDATANKGTAAAGHAARRGIDREQAVAFGDQMNDLPMMEWSGYSIAMGNAHEAIKRAADEIAPTNTDDGVARVLMRMLAGD